MKFLITPKDNNGAILIISIIIGVIALAAGLTAANFVSRSTRNITDQESSIKALSISESGVEKVLGASDVANYPCPLTTLTTPTNEGYIPNLNDSLVDGNRIPTTLDAVLLSPTFSKCFFREDTNGGTNYNQSYYLEVTSKGGASTYTMDSVEKDTVLEISTEGLNTENLTINWTDESGNYASLLITEVYKVGSDYKVKKYAFNPADGHLNGGQTSNGFLSANNELASITLTAGTKIIRIKPLYYSANNIVVTTGGNLFPTANQGFDIYSTGCTCANVLDLNSRQNASVRKVKVTKTREHLPAIFDYVLYSGSETDPLTK